MATDLTKVNDHPIAVLRKAAQDAHEAQTSPTAQAAYTAAAETLFQHEQTNGVIFAALDKDALARVAEAYGAFSDHRSERKGGELASAIADLLGLDG